MYIEDYIEDIRAYDSSIQSGPVVYIASTGGRRSLGWSAHFHFHSLLVFRSETSLRHGIIDSLLTDRQSFHTEECQSHTEGGKETDGNEKNKAVILWEKSHNIIRMKLGCYEN